MTGKYCYILSIVTLLILMSAPSYAGPYIVEGFTRNMDFNITVDPNVSNAWKNSDGMDDILANLTLGGAYSQSVSNSGLMVVSGYLGYKHHQQFDDLDAISLSVDGTYYLQFEHGYLAPIYQIGVAYTLFRYADSDNREGGLVTFKLGVSKRFSTKTFAFLNYEHKSRDADNKTYDTGNDLLTLGFEYRLATRLTLYSDLQIVTGDLVSDANGVNGQFADAIDADALVSDPVFDCRTGCENWSYRFEGDGLVSTTGLVFALSPSVSMDLSARLYNWEGDAGIDSSDWSGMLGFIWHF